MLIQCEYINKASCNDLVFEDITYTTSPLDFWLAIVADWQRQTSEFGTGEALIVVIVNHWHWKCDVLASSMTI